MARGLGDGHSTQRHLCFRLEQSQLQNAPNRSHRRATWGDLHPERLGAQGANFQPARCAYQHIHHRLWRGWFTDHHGHTVHSLQHRSGTVTFPENATTVRVELFDYMTDGWVAVDDVSLMGATVTKYYYLGSQRVAMRQGGVLTYLHGDHLGSASLATDVSGTKVGEQRSPPLRRDAERGDAHRSAVYRATSRH